MIVIATLSYIQFQSPLHRGNHFNNGLRAGELIQLQISVPSSSGKSLQLCIVDQASMRLTISVPSSSGKSLQRRSRPAASTPATVFQSPLHRGNHFNIGYRSPHSFACHISVPSSSGKSLQHYDKPFAVVANGNFSPLFIGEITSTRLVARAHPKPVISVPSSSGKSLQRASQMTGGVQTYNFSPLFIGEITSTSSQHRFQSRLRHFSPLFIGEITSTAAHPTRGKGKYKFQSPLHRGNHFNATAPGISRGHWRISVPSSSGKSLQPVLLWERRAKEIDFSPLFIGEITSTPWEAASTALLTDFSPLFIGEITSTKDVPARSCHRGNFSPLFIGEITSTPGGWNLLRRTDEFQSPLHRGNHFNMGKLSIRPWHNAISVPSSSGKSLQHHRATGLWNQGSFQSTLHRGNHFNRRRAVPIFVS